MTLLGFTSLAYVGIAGRATWKCCDGSDVDRMRIGWRELTSRLWIRDHGTTAHRDTRKARA
jgi:hypothetical protein